MADLTDWTEDDVSNFVSGLGGSKVWQEYGALVHAKKLDGATIMHLEIEDLIQCGFARPHAIVVKKQLDNPAKKKLGAGSHSGPNTARGHDTKKSGANSGNEHRPKSSGGQREDGGVFLTGTGDEETNFLETSQEAWVEPTNDAIEEKEDDQDIEYELDESLNLEENYLDSVVMYQTALRAKVAQVELAAEIKDSLNVTAPQKSATEEKEEETVEPVLSRPPKKPPKPFEKARGRRVRKLQKQNKPANDDADLIALKAEGYFDEIQMNAALKQILGEILVQQRRLDGKDVFEFTAKRLRQLGRKVGKLKQLERLQDYAKNLQPHMPNSCKCAKCKDLRKESWLYRLRQRQLEKEQIIAEEVQVLLKQIQQLYDILDEDMVTYDPDKLKGAKAPLKLKYDREQLVKRIKSEAQFQCNIVAQIQRETNKLNRYLGHDRVKLKYSSNELKANKKEMQEWLQKRDELMEEKKEKSIQCLAEMNKMLAGLQLPLHEVSDEDLENLHLCRMRELEKAKVKTLLIQRIEVAKLLKEVNKLRGALKLEPRQVDYTIDIEDVIMKGDFEPPTEEVSQGDGDIADPESGEDSDLEEEVDQARKNVDYTDKFFVFCLTNEMAELKEVSAIIKTIQAAREFKSLESRQYTEYEITGNTNKEGELKTLEKLKELSNKIERGVETKDQVEEDIKSDEKENGTEKKEEATEGNKDEEASENKKDEAATEDKKDDVEEDLPQLSKEDKLYELKMKGLISWKVGDYIATARVAAVCALEDRKEECEEIIQGLPEGWNKKGKKVKKGKGVKSKKEETTGEEKSKPPLPKQSKPKKKKK